MPKPEDLPKWNYDGSSTGQARVIKTEVFQNSSRAFQKNKIKKTQENTLGNILENPKILKNHQIY